MKKQSSELDSPTGPGDQPSKRPKLDLKDEGDTSTSTGSVNATGNIIHQSSEGGEKSPHSKKNKDKNLKGRRRRDTASRDQWQERNPDASKEPRLPKRECALMIGFCGSKYSGMQLCKTQPGLLEQRTIEGELFKALVAAGAVSKDNSEDPVKVGLARAARTDAGVHAVGNVVSLKMIMSVPGVDDLRARINSLLPPDIRLWGFQRVQRSFNARLLCDARKYTYFFPSYLLIPPKPGSHLDRALREYANLQECEIPWNDDPFWSTVDFTTSTSQEDMIRKRAWRATPGHVERLRSIIQKFEKTHNFHNFTVARDPKDKTNNRFMKKLQVAEPAVYGETEWIAVSLNGQSFMLHQRKMMFALVMLCRTGTPASVLDEMFKLTTIHIPKMPALGLLLEHPVFTGYNTKLAKKLTPSDPDYREPIDFENYSEEMNTFKQRSIYDNMRNIEDRKGLFDGWIRSIDSYKGNDFLYLNPKGTIPPEAILTKGERRQNPFRERKVFNLTSFAEEDNEKVREEEPPDEADEAEESMAEESMTKKELEEAEG
ncbi:pseudouridine synthase [Lentinula aciculospora]|uniref:tRNA pseudouridine synthase 1 n=1 Tax=Lentinula aciculospora TaxID=153920 RepID=A0A9W8ZYL4_9AGAR|nr:pseudouridine synthase [Lentinula aciculospora]